MNCCKCNQPLQERYTGIQHEYKNPIPFAHTNETDNVIPDGWLMCLNTQCEDGKHNSSIISEPIPF
jgi:hypothetical protein